MNACPYCDGKLNTVNVVHNTDDDETYRLKKCVVCNRELYTVEFEVEDNLSFHRTYRKWVTKRTYASRRRNKK